MCRIDTTIREWADCVRDLRDPHPGSTKEGLIAWQAEIWELLGALDVRDHQLAVSAVSHQHQGDLGGASILEVSEIERHVRGSVSVGPSAPRSVTVCYCYTISVPLAADCPLNVGYDDVLYWQKLETTE